ncbi:hypothetical protein KAR91_53250 [Candidatus Pacearchaeota archaeon]|nr:hypothetical protein [Candidatus Pacearchaeota archaeon]
MKKAGLVHNMRKMGPPSKKQQAIKDYIFKPEPDRVKKVDVSCGRAFGKSTVAIDVAKDALNIDGNQIGLFLEPDTNRMNKVFLLKWKKHVPPELYKINKGERCIEWWNGSFLYYGIRNITGSVAQMEDGQSGPDYTFVIDDEAAMKCSLTFYANVSGTIRAPSDVRFYLTITTPRVGPYKRLVTSPGHKLFMGTSFDNPYLPKNFVKDLMETMSKQQIRREIYGEFVSLEGRIWKEFDSQNAWPKGNIDHVHQSFDSNKPWFLFCDLGSANGAFAVVQRRDANNHGDEVFDGDVWVIVADLCPYKDASASRAFRILDSNFGSPCCVVAGADIHKRDGGSGKTMAYFSKQVWSNVPIIPVSEKVFDRQVQYDRMSYMVCSGKGERRLTVAKNFVSLDPDSKRGVLEMFEEDAFPENREMAKNEILPKDSNNVVQHIRDALLMGTVAKMSPPTWNYSEDYTA